MPLTYEEIAARLATLPAPPADEGRVVLVVARPDKGARHLPDRARLCTEAGVEGDRWSAAPNPNPENQITLMRADFHELIGEGQPLSTAGDNLVVELDLSERNLPAGTLLEIGTAVCEVTPLPHTGCGQFERRFGPDARRLANSAEYAEHRLRGIHVTVREPGEVSPGDAIRVRSRA